MTGSAERARTKRKLVVCCDGTWNLPNQAGKPTNVVKILRAIRPVDDYGNSQIVHYHPGVGTGNFVDRFNGGSVGAGLTSNVQSAYGFLVDNYLPGDEIYLFGFSRGAYTVRSLAGFIDLVGLLEKIDMSLFVEVFDVYRKHQLYPKNKTPDELAGAFLPYFSRDTNDRLRGVLRRSRRDTGIFFIGVWDTVGALGIPFGPLRSIGRSHYDFHSTQLTGSVRFAYQALAIDEHRQSYEPSIWIRPVETNGAPTSKIQTLEQVWFAGAHSNIGGGYVDDSLSDIAFLWMAAKATAARETASDPPLALDKHYLANAIQKTMGRLINSRTLKWRMRKALKRSLLDPSRVPDGMESCEKIHEFVLRRYEHPHEQFVPFPYRPANAVKYLDKPDPTNFANLTAFEKTYGVFT